MSTEKEKITSGRTLNRGYQLFVHTDQPNNAAQYHGDGAPCQPLDMYILVCSSVPRHVRPTLVTLITHGLPNLPLVAQPWYQASNTRRID